MSEEDKLYLKGYVSRSVLNATCVAMVFIGLIGGFFLGLAWVDVSPQSPQNLGLTAKEEFDRQMLAFKNEAVDAQQGKWVIKGNGHDQEPGVVFIWLYHDPVKAVEEKAQLAKGVAAIKAASGQ